MLNNARHLLVESWHLIIYFRYMIDRSIPRNAMLMTKPSEPDRKKEKDEGSKQLSTMTICGESRKQNKG